MRERILNFPQQVQEGANAVGNLSIESSQYDRIIVCGMGGSIIPGLMFLTYKEHQNQGPGVPILINNNYDLPSDVTSEDLVVCISWSGTTEETISAFQAALKRNILPVVITKGAELGQLAKQTNAPLITLPSESSPPRLSVGYMVGSLFAVLGLKKDLDIQLDAGSYENSGRELAVKINGKIPIIYASYSWRKLGGMWKANINETAKTPAYWNYMPVMAHDELVTYSRKGLHFYPIVFRDENDQPRYKRDLNAAIAIFNRLEYNYSIVDLISNSNPLEQVLHNYVLGLWTSYYLAKNLDVEPDNIELIEEFKKLKKEF